MIKKMSISLAAFIAIASLNAQSVTNVQKNVDIKGDKQLSGQHAIGGWGVQSANIIDSTLPRILLIGDSMLGQYGNEVVKELTGLVNVDRWKTPQFVSDNLALKVAQIVSAQPYQLIHFNESGLHSLAKDRIKQGEYGIYMEKYLKAIKQSAPKAVLIWANTTPVTIKDKPGMLDDTLTNVVIEHNTAVEPLIKTYNLHVDDHYSLMIGHLDLAKGDKWHWNNNGAKLMAQSVVESIKKELPIK